MKIINFDYMYLWDLHCALGSLQTSILLTRTSASERVKEVFKASAKQEIEEYREKHSNSPQWAQINIKTVKITIKDYHKFSKNVLKCGIPDFLHDEYNEVATDINDAIRSINKDNKTHFRKIKLA